MFYFPVSYDAFATSPIVKVAKLPISDLYGNIHLPYGISLAASPMHHRHQETLISISDASQAVTINELEPFK